MRIFTEGGPGSNLGAAELSVLFAMYDSVDLIMRLQSGRYLEADNNEKCMQVHMFVTL